MLPLWWTRPGASEPEVVGSDYLHSYVQPEDDQDADGLPDAWEISVGLDPTDAAGGGYADTDHDSLNDIDEYQRGLNPTVAFWQDGGVPGCLQVERWNGIANSDSMAVLFTSGRFGEKPGFN